MDKVPRSHEILGTVSGALKGLPEHQAWSEHASGASKETRFAAGLYSGALVVPEYAGYGQDRPAIENPARHMTEDEQKLARLLGTAPKVGRLTLIASRALLEAQQGTAAAKDWKESSHPIVPTPQTRKEERVAKKIHKYYAMGPDGQKAAKERVRSLTNKWSTRVEKRNERTRKAKERVEKMKERGQVWSYK